ncbi:hypothetical protein ANCCAN_19755 [Ancylostoma caninum]|uniref:Uncharacterized protein n=1 Tax=Ancylostoma caninum TaxID=29170 RepID=A0A368FQG1_ANCCA|nr:hypothetical protein ANCCAN_19755 [Ancylostoma caninum]
MRKRAKDCENGIPIEKLVLPPGYAPIQQDDAQAPSTPGYVTVNFNEPVNKKQGEERADDGGGYLNVRISTTDHNSYNNKASEYQGATGKQTVAVESRNSGYDQAETVGQVSSPVGDGDYEKVKFPRISNREGAPRSEMTEENGSLTISSKPRLSFPGDVVAVATKQGVVVVDLHRKGANTNHTTRRPFPRNNKTHDENFEHAMKNTIEYKARIEQMRRGEAARQGLDSLLQAGQHLFKAVATAAVASGARHPGAIEPAVPKVSGSMRSFEMADDEADDDQRRGEFVTSSPVIFVGKNNSTSRVLNRSGDCGPPMKTQTKRLQVILALLGERNDSDDMKEIKHLIEEWHKSFRHKVTSAKEKAKKAEISKALEELVNKFDRVNLQLIRNATLNDIDFSDDDDEILTNPCELISIEESIDGGIDHHDKGHIEDTAGPKHKFDRARAETNGDRIVLEDGFEKVILSDGESTMDMSLDSAETTGHNNEKTDSSSRESDIIHNWSNEEYKRELEKYKKEHHINSTSEGRNETSCDLYMRCRNQMHLAVDSCAWRFASSKILPSLAESAESLLYKGEEFCDPAEQPLYEELYEMVIKRNTGLRKCLDKKNEIFFSSSICIPYSASEHVMFSSAFLRLLSEDYKHSSECFRDANLIQEKCTKLRECCPNFDSCRQETMDITLEQAIISKTAQLNEDKQNCLKQKAREAFKKTLRELLGKGGRGTLQKLKRGELGLDIARGAQVLARLR